jgi:hypothetical protein
MRDGTTSGTFTLPGMSGNTTAEVIGESRTVPVTAGAFSDTFDGYGVHLYKLATSAGGGGGGGSGGGSGGTPPAGTTGSSGDGGGGGGGSCGLTGAELLAVYGLMLLRRIRRGHRA